MFRHLSLLAVRNLVKHKIYTILNVGGLAVGLMCFAFIACWINDEMSYDAFNSKADRIVRVATRLTIPGESFDQAITSGPVASAMKADFPEVESAVRLETHGAIVKYGDNQADEDGILISDASIFDVFDFHLSQGNVHTALNAPYNVVLTESMAKKYFGHDDAIGKTIAIYMLDSTGRGASYHVTGIVADPPLRSHFRFKFLVSFKTLESYSPGSVNAWDKNGDYTYLLLKNKGNIKKLSAEMPAFALRHRQKYMEEEKSSYAFWLQPLRSIHLHSHLLYEIAPTGSMQNVYIFATIGIFILLIACINYMNLASARASERAKETGVKKVLGAKKTHLVLQHLGEACLVALGGLLAALILGTILQPLFKELTGREFSIYRSTRLILFLIGITTLVGILSGIYPSLLITTFKPAEVLKSKLKSTAGGVLLRKSLVVLQFTIAIVLIAGILVVSSQLSYIKHKDLGYRQDALLNLKVNGNTDVVQNYEAFKNAVLSKSLVKGITTSNAIIVGGLGNRGVKTVSGSGEQISSILYSIRADQDYVDVYKMKLLAGRNFYQNISADSFAYIVNEAAMRSFGWKNADDAINKPFNASGKAGKVIGVVKDFHFSSLHQMVEPLVVMPRLARDRFSQISLRIDMSEPQKAIDWIADNWKKSFPGALLEYNFMDRQLNDQYTAENRFSRFFFYFSIVALIIACLGLFGLTSFTIHQRVKEIGIRKVLGASVANITSMLSSEFLKLVIIATILAVPIAGYVMNKWLQEFAYRVSMSWWMFVEAGASALIIALITVGVQTAKAAVAKPVKSLRTE